MVVMNCRFVVHSFNVSKTTTLPPHMSSDYFFLPCHALVLGRCVIVSTSL